MDAMIDLYTWTTPNGRKVSILLEELGMPYAVHPVDLGKDEQHRPELLRISPKGHSDAVTGGSARRSSIHAPPVYLTAVLPRSALVHRNIVDHPRRARRGVAETRKRAAASRPITLYCQR